MGTLRLTLLRHGHTQPQHEAAQDYERQLTARGRTEARHMGERLAKASLVPDLILASSARRTQTTAQLLAAAAMVPAGRIQLLDELYNASADRIWNIATAHAGAWHAGKARHVLVCGHNPGISRLASHLGVDPQARDLPPAGLVTGTWHHQDWTALQAADATDLAQLLP
ncbi:MAG: SixA phosphatase family protein [Steroidobacterales bacterium]